VITDRFVLPPDAEMVPVDTVAADLRSRFAHRPGDYVISRSSGRAGTHVVDASSAGLLERFRGGTTISDAVLAFSRASEADPERVLTDAWPVLQKLIRARLLVPERNGAAGTVAPRLSVGEQIDDWTAVSCVYLLEDTELWQVRDSAGRWYALKLARSAQDAVVGPRLQREASMLTMLAGRVGPRLTGRAADYLVLEWCWGTDVETAAAEYRTWPVEAGRAALWQLVTAVVDAYVALHAAGAVHGDVHPGNLLVDRDGRVTILDFAFARRVAPGDEAGPRGGVPFYYEPELARAVSDGATVPQASAEGEQFAIAAVLYRLIAGAHYREFPLDRASFWRAIAEEPPRAFVAAGVAPWPAVETVLARALAKDPRARYPNVAAFAAALRAGDMAPSPAIASAQSVRPSERARVLVDRVLQRAADGVGQGMEGLAEVMDGMAGVAYMLYRVALGRGDPRLLALADVWAERAQTGAARPETAEPCSPVSPYHTMSGVHVVRALIAHARGDDVSRREAVGDFIVASMVGPVDPDLTLGTAGVLLATAMLVEALRGKDCDDLRAHGMRVSDDLQRVLDAPSDLTTSGAAHGWAGALGAVLRWCAATGARPSPVIGRRLAELAAYAEPRGRGVRWPWHLHAADPTYAPGWCNGTAGMAALWTLAARVTGDPSFDALADRSAWHSWEHAVGTADVCCGDAGVAYAMLMRYQATGDLAWYRRAVSLADRAAPRAAEENSLFRGDIGVALLVAELDWPEEACMPFFGHEGWPTLAGDKGSGGY
jgi:eukaryotic-like serine/threonine-protein kinase